MTAVPLVVSLTPATNADLTSLGGKGASLARLVSEGLPVPPTAVVTTNAYRWAAGSLHTDLAGAGGTELHHDEAVHDRFEALHVPASLRSAIADAAASIGGGGPIAVRSSATVEDLGGASFAGQYRSILDVDSSDPAAVCAAIRSVWASLWFDAPVAYRQALGFDNPDIAMAVVLMKMIPAELAGVVFTKDPGGGPGARIEMVEGLGEALVSGERTPSAWVVEPGEEATLPSVALRALELARRVETFEGIPQDIEWAASGGEVWLVQARPITTLDTGDGFDSPIDDHLLTTAGIGEMVPGVVPPLLWQLNRFLLEEAYRSMFANLGIMPAISSRSFVRRVRGRIAIDFDRLCEVAAAIPGAVRDLEVEYFGEAMAPVVRQEEHENLLHRTRRAFRTGGRQFRAARSRQHAVDQADVVVHAVDLLWPRRPSLSTQSDDEVMQYAVRLVDLASRGLAAELAVAAAAAGSFARLETQLSRYLGAERGALRAQYLTAGVGIDRANESGASAAIFGGPTWRELGRNVPSFVGSVSNETNCVERMKELDKELTSLPGWKRTRILTGQVIDVRRAFIRQLVEDVRQQLRRREAAKASVLRLGGEVRRVHLHLGVRLQRRGVLDRSDDVHLLTTHELASACRGSSCPGPAVLRQRRRWLETYENEEILPLRFRGEPDRTLHEAPEGDHLCGWAASPGTARGVGQVVRRPTEPFATGSILLAEATDASWSPLFLRAAGIVVERGGPLSHAAILARELGLPAVLNLQGACAALEGRSIVVDGSTGVVSIESEAAA